jgi:hypothetical protein
MEQSTPVMCESDNRLILLRQKQAAEKEGSKQWANLQAKINVIIADNYLHYVNR